MEEKALNAFVDLSRPASPAVCFVPAPHGAVRVARAPCIGAAGAAAVSLGHAG
jgi:hypothetical protein